MFFIDIRSPFFMLQSEIFRIEVFLSYKYGFAPYQPMENKRKKIKFNKN
jgi:hypothetical protein